MMNFIDLGFLMLIRINGASVAQMVFQVVVHYW